jgi:SPP1 family predicted phage head-tail adaptor
MSLAAGTLNRLVTISRIGDAQDSTGQPVADPVPIVVCTVWASIRNLSGLAAVRAGAEAAAVKTSIRIRYRKDLTIDMWVESDSTKYNINAVLPDEAKREYVDLVCEPVS